MRLTLTIVTILAVAGTASAGEIYVSPTGSGTLATIDDPASLETGIALAEQRGGNDIIYVAKGDYPASGDPYLHYDASEDNGSSLTISGGWNSTYDSQSPAPQVTTIGGGGVSALLRITAGDFGSRSTVVLRNLKFANGRAESTHGGAVLADQSSAGKLSLIVEDCIFEANSATGGRSGGAVYANCHLEMRRCTLVDNDAWSGGGLFIENPYEASPPLIPVVEDTVFRGNLGTGDSGGSSVWCATVSVFRRCEFFGRTGGASAGIGAPFLAYGFASPSLQNCRFENFVTDGDGCGVEFANFRGGTVSGCLFGYNLARGGGGALRITDPYDADVPVVVTNATFVGNRSGDGTGAALTSLDSAPQVHNSIFWDNGPDGVSNATGTEGATLFYSFLEGTPATTGFTDGGKNIFRARESPFAGARTYWLGVTSPCVDSGDNNAPRMTTEDLYGLDRIADGDLDTVPVVDMGAFEMIPPKFLPYSGTIGTRILMIGSGYGEKKPRVWLQYYDSQKARTRKKALKVLDYSDTRCLVYVSAKLPSGKYDLVLQPKDLTAPEQPLGNFSILAPADVAVDRTRASPGEAVTITGLHFGDRKAKLKAFFEYVDKKGRTRKKTMKTVKESLAFDPVTGESRVSVLVPKLKGLPTDGRILMTTKVARDPVVAADSFRVE